MIDSFNWTDYLGKLVYVQTITGCKFAGAVTRVEVDKMTNRQMLVVDSAYVAATQDIRRIAELVNIKDFPIGESDEK